MLTRTRSCRPSTSGTVRTSASFLDPDCCIASSRRSARAAASRKPQRWSLSTCRVLPRRDSGLKLRPLREWSAVGVSRSRRRLGGLLLDLGRHGETRALTTPSVIVTRTAAAHSAPTRSAAPRRPQQVTVASRALAVVSVSLITFAGEVRSTTTAVPRAWRSSDRPASAGHACHADRAVTHHNGGDHRMSDIPVPGNPIIDNITKGLLWLSEQKAYRSR
jgi:hypothetical protein